MTTAEVVDPECADAEREAAEAEGLVAALEAKVLDGDDKVTAEKLASAADLSRFARLRLEAARRKAERKREQRRLADLAALREEMESFAATSGPRFVELLTAAADAVAEFKAAVDERNQLVAGWRTRAENLGVEPGPADEEFDSGVALGSAWGEVLTPSCRFLHLHADQWLAPGLGVGNVGPGTKIVFNAPRADLERLRQLDRAE